MRFLGKCGVLFFSVFLLLSADLAAAAGPSREELIEMPAAAVVTGRNVNFRSEPSTKGKILGRFGEGQAWEELLVVDAASGEDGHLWYKALSEHFGEGWISGRYLRFEGLDDQLWRFFLLVRRDFGTTPAMTERLLGKPLKIERQTFRPEDFSKDVTSVEMLYPEGKVIYWLIDMIPFLVELDFEGGARGFGPISFGDGPEKVEQVLGDPHDVRSWVWTYHSGMQRIHVGFRLGPNDEVKVARLLFERDAY